DASFLLFGCSGDACARHKLWKRKRRQNSRKEEKTHRAERRANAPEGTEEIVWQPISQLPLIGSMIDEMYKDDQDQHALYLEASEKPHVLDDATVNRAIRLYDERLDMIVTVFGPQLELWKAEELTPPQRQEVERLLGELADLRALDEKIMALLKEIMKETIDAVMRKSDFELGFETLYGKVPLTDKQQALAQKIDTWVKGIEARGGGDEQILQGMYDYMTTFKQIMDNSSKVQMDKLCAQYPGFDRFASLLNALARGIADGAIDVP
ncbi:MAG TPA: hypothetical protein VKQ72_04815, partial [Aggregatilineales bacterium]|nr:hypothetical protein [Aggregatilineales bacterium]